jgi:hypothetical protein
MMIQRVVRCCAVTCLLAITMPHASVVLADEGRRNHSEVEECDEDDATSTSVEDRSESDRRGHRSEHNEGPGHDARDGERNDDDDDEGDDDDCIIAPPAEVPEAPQTLMLSASAIGTGAIAMLVLRRRAKSTSTTAA